MELCKVYVGREAVWNEGTREAAMNVVDAESMEGEGWFKVSPFGVFEGATRGRQQYFGREQARAMVEEFNSLRGRLGRLFRGVPIYIGHPDVDPTVWTDHRRLGKVRDMEVRDDGLWALPDWNRLGMANVEEGYWVYPSPYWDAPAGGARFEPVRLISIGLTNFPRIPTGAGNEPVTNAEQVAPTVKVNSEVNDMDRDVLIEKLGLKADATDEEILAEMDGIMEAVARLSEELEGKKAEAAATEAEAEDAREKLEAAENARVKAETELGKVREVQANGLLDAAMKDGRVAMADRERWLGEFARDFEGATNSLAAVVAKLNTKSLDLSGSRLAVSDERRRRETVANAVNRLMEEKGMGYHEAYAHAKNMPELRGVWEGMQKAEG